MQLFTLSLSPGFSPPPYTADKKWAHLMSGEHLEHLLILSDHKNSFFFYI